MDLRGFTLTVARRGFAHLRMNTSPMIQSGPRGAGTSMPVSVSSQYWDLGVKPCGARVGTRKGGQKAPRVYPKILVLTCEREEADRAVLDGVVLPA